MLVSNGYRRVFVLANFSMGWVTGLVQSKGATCRIADKDVSQWGDNLMPRVIIWGSPQKSQIRKLDHIQNIWPANGEKARCIYYF